MAPLFQEQETCSLRGAGHGDTCYSRRHGWIVPIGVGFDFGRKTSKDEAKAISQPAAGESSDVDAAS